MVGSALSWSLSAQGAGRRLSPTSLQSAAPRSSVEAQRAGHQARAMSSPSSIPWGFARARVVGGVTWGKASRAPVENEYERVSQKRLDGAASGAISGSPARVLQLQPGQPYAQEELARCSKDPVLHYGLKSPLGNSDVDPTSERRGAVKEVFAAANRYGCRSSCNLRTSIDHHRRYGADQASDS